MKKLVIFLAFSIASVSLVAQHRQHPENYMHHYITISGQVGDHSWLGDVPVRVDNRLGVGGGVGVGYEYHYNHFILNAGVNVNLSRSGFKTDWTTKNDPLADTTGTFNFEVSAKKDGSVKNLYVYQFTNRYDAYSHATIQPHLLVGGQWKGFYALAGVKFDTRSLWCRTVSSTDINSYGQDLLVDTKTIHANQTGSTDLELDANNNPVKGYYSLDNALYIGEDGKFLDGKEDLYYSDLERVTQHANTVRNTFKFNWNVSASLELGWTSGSRMHVFQRSQRAMNYQYRIGAYMDFGLKAWNYADSLNMAFSHPEYKGIYEGSKHVGMATPMHEITMNDLLTSNFGGTNIRPLQVGIKCTFLFELPKKQPCVTCKDVAPRNKKHKGLITE